MQLKQDAAGTFVNSPNKYKMKKPKHILIPEDNSETLDQLYKLIREMESYDSDFKELDYYQKLSAAIGIQRNSLLAIINDVSIQH